MAPVIPGGVPQADVDGAGRALLTSTGSRVHVARSITGRSHASAAHQWRATWQQLREGHAMWREGGAERGADGGGGGGGGAADTGAGTGGVSGDAPAAAQRLRELLDGWSRRMLLVPDIPGEFAEKSAEKGAESRERGGACSSPPTSAAPGAADPPSRAPSEHESADAADLGKVQTKVGKLMLSVVRSLQQSSIGAGGKFGAKSGASGESYGELQRDEEGDDDDDEADDDADADAHGGTPGVGTPMSTAPEPSVQMDAELVRPHGVLVGKLTFGHERDPAEIIISEMASRRQMARAPRTPPRPRPCPQARASFGSSRPAAATRT